MPLRGGGGDQDEQVFGLARDGHFGQDATPIIREIDQPAAPDLGQCACDLAAQPFIGTGARDLEPGKPRQVQHAAMIADGFAFFFYALGPCAVAVPGLGRGFVQVIAVLGEPVGTFPAVIGPHHATQGADLGVNGR